MNVADDEEKGKWKEERQKKKKIIKKKNAFVAIQLNEMRSGAKGKRKPNRWQAGGARHVPNITWPPARHNSQVQHSTIHRLTKSKSFLTFVRACARLSKFKPIVGVAVPSIWLLATPLQSSSMPLRESIQTP